MVLNKAGKDFLFKEEGVKLEAYKDAKGIPTIGIGSTYYEDGSKVQMGDKITKKRAYELFDNIVKSYEKAVNDYVKPKINQKQFNALVSLAFNIGIKGFKGSTLLRRINTKESEEQIRKAFYMWKYSGSKPILLGRRKREADLYFS